jgi:NAD(P)H-flavin reductase
MAPEPARVLSAARETADTVTMTLALPGPVRPFLPGQFNMLYAFGVGEVPISMSGDPARSEVLVHTVRAVGAVTEALCAVATDDVIGVRGPYGAPWPMDVARGADLLLVAGGLGLAPLRPALYHALNRRADYRRLFLLVGARSPADLLFRSELDGLKQRDDITVLVTVDHASMDWKGRVGVVPALLADLELDARGTVAFVCGPEVMMRFTVRELGRRGIAGDRIHLSMERSMKCAVGFCGHCQLGPSFICKDGPVLPYDRIRSLFWLREA